MSVPDELVQAAAEAFMRPDVRRHYRQHPDADAQAYYEAAARRALQAAFAKLPECEAAERAIETALHTIDPHVSKMFRSTVHEASRLTLAALAREFGGQK